MRDLLTWKYEQHGFRTDFNLILDFYQRFHCNTGDPRVIKLGLQGGEGGRQWGRGHWNGTKLKRNCMHVHLVLLNVVESRLQRMELQFDLNNMVVIVPCSWTSMWPRQPHSHSHHPWMKALRRASLKPSSRRHPPALHQWYFYLFHFFSESLTVTMILGKKWFYWKIERERERGLTKMRPTHTKHDQYGMIRNSDECSESWSDG